MIYNYPYYGFPNYMNSNLNLKSKNFQRKSTYNPYDFNVKDNKVNLKNNKSLDKINRPSNSSKKSNNQDFPIFELFGIKLYFDDVLLICLIFFLYSEKIDDTYLMIALILLLLS